MLRKSLFIIIPVIVVIGLIFGYGITTYNSKYVAFQADGHIIAKSSKSSTEKYFFNDESKYKIVEDEVVIENKDKKSTVIPVETFIHYADGSISTFAKSVVLDLNEMNKENYNYYNVFSGTVFVKDGANYNINYLDKKLKFNNFLLKITDEKFMIVGNKIKLKVGDTEKEFDNNYLEITYLEGNLIRIENQGSSYQSVGDDVTIEIGDKVLVDFGNKNIYKDNNRKLALGEITVDSDDNIEINADDNKYLKTTADGKDAEEGSKTGGSGNSGSNNNSKNNSKKYTKEELPSMSTGVVDTSETIEEVVDANARVKDAEFKIINLNVTANALKAEVQITDTDSVLQGDINIKIIEANTNKIIYETTDDSGSNIIEIENEALNPETNYVLAINSDYRKNDTVYNKDFVQKTFVTDAIGVSLEKYFVSTNELDVNIKKSSYSTVASVDVALEDPNGAVISQRTVSLELNDNIVTFDSLKNDTGYKVRVYNFVYNNSVVTDGFTILKGYETLKKKPTIGSLSFTMDKKESKFNLQVNNMIDPDGGIVSYKYEVYDARTVNSPGVIPITTIEKNNNASASVKVDGKNIVRGVPYVFRVIMTFNDNEKEYDYITDFSEAMKLDGVEFPVVKFNKSLVTFERIAGEIEIIDDGNTIDIDGGSVITITYTDSVGNSNSFTSSGTLRIPFDINNLRSNETYSFSVTAPVNLQDGNPIVSNCYIGSVIVKTEDPNPFNMNFTPIDDAAYAFAVDAQIVSGNEGSNELEANTLTGFNINIYQGRNTSGTLVKTKKLVDRDLEPYSSELRDNYYDKVFKINPGFFEMKNSDFKSEYYTIEITSAYDYTTHKNNLPINNNTITVKIENALPDLPPNFDDAVEMIEIKNGDIDGEDRREDLNDNTIVGYRFKAAYNNEAKYALKIKYTIHSLDGTVIGHVDYDVPKDGTIDYSELFLDDGILPANPDDDLRRGQSFYITFEVDLDTNYDGVADSIYPMQGVTLKSITNSPKRQRPTIQLYPSKSDSGSYTWGYKYSDVDHALADSKITGYLDGSSIGDKTLSISNNYQNIKFDVNKAGLFTIFARYNLINDEDSEEVQLTSQYFEGVNNLDFGKVSIYPENNRVIFSFLDYQDKLDLFSKVSSVKIDFVTSSKTITLDKLSAKTGNITINYSQIEELKGKTITPNITLYYDAGIYGFDNEGDNFALQQIRHTDGDPYYYYFFENNRINTGDSANRSFMSYEFNIKQNKFVVHDKIFDFNSTYNILNTSYGIDFNNTFVSPKKLLTKNVSFQGSNSFSFNKIIPGISILDENNLPTIEPMINTASVKINTYGVENQIRDNVYVELYSIQDESASEVTLVDTYEYTIEQLKNKITFTNLVPDQDYYFKVYAYVRLDNGSFEKNYLYDINQQRDGVNYYFKTINNVGITDLSVKYKAFSYNDRRLKITYDLSQTIGFSKIIYKVYKDLGNNQYQHMENLVTPVDTVFKNNMTSYIRIPNSSGVVTGNSYMIVVQPVVESNSGEIELESASKMFKFNNLYKPYIYISSRYNKTSGLKFIVNVKDYHKTIVDGLFRVQILENDVDVTPSVYSGREYSITDFNQDFVISNFNENSKYTFNVLYNADFTNNEENISNNVYTYSPKINLDSGIDLGTIYADPDMLDNTKVNLRFFDSSGLSDVKRVRYSIYDTNDFSIDNEVAFVPKLITSPSTYYEFQLPDPISNEGVYYISIQFLDSQNNILGEDTVEYRLL